MRNKFATITLTAILFSGSTAMAKETKFANYQAIIVNALSSQKPLIDEQIACVKSSLSKKDIKQCAKNTKSAIKKLQAEKISSIKEMSSKAKLAKDLLKKTPSMPSLGL
ncbi:MAG: hypothetical protein ACJAW3_001303 [Lentimonas sp.]|jgi:hypothetical protein